MNRTKTVFAAALLCLLAQDARAEPDERTLMPDLREACERGWGMERPTRFDQLIAALGQPKSVKTAVEPNPHVADEKLEWRHLEFGAGLRVGVVLLDRDPNRMLVSSASITSAVRRLPGGLHIGDPKSAFVSRFGTPQSDEAKELTWYCSDADYIAATLDSDRVSELHWVYYVD